MSLLRCIALLVAVLGYGTPSLGMRCPSPDWNYRATTDKCYFVYNLGGSSMWDVPADEETWQDALKQCEARGGRLMTGEAKDAGELDWLMDGKLDQKTYWLGLTYENLKWEWVDGKTRRDYSTSPIANLKVVNPPDNYPENLKRLQRGVIRFDEVSGGYAFASETELDSHGYICKGDYLARPWCKVEEGWTYRNGKCYRYQPTPRQYLDAKKVCGAEGGWLVVPDTAEEDRNMRTWLKNSHVEAGWIGFALLNKGDIKFEDAKWADGTSAGKFPINNWKEKDMTAHVDDLPAGYNYCGHLDIKEADDRDWFLTSNCYSERPFVCEAPMNKCPSGWTGLNDKCYQIKDGLTNLHTRAAAEEICTKQKANLVVIPNADIQYFIEANFPGALMDGGTHNYWTDLRGSAALEWQWGTGAAYSYNNLVTGPHKPDPETCVFLYGDPQEESFVGKWEPTLCSNKFNYICEAPTSSMIEPPLTPKPEIKCDNPFAKFHEGCYLTVPHPMNRDEAQKYCQLNYHSVLAVVEAAGINTWLRGKISKDSWIGLRINRTEINGATGKKQFVYDFSDGRTVGPGAFMNFKDEPPVDEIDTHKDYCVFMAGKDSAQGPLGSWYHAPCNVEKEFACYHDGTPQEVPVPVDSVTDPQCGAGWFRDGTNCYAIRPQKATWQLAKQICQNEDVTADLLWLTNKQEEQFIKDYVEENQVNEGNEPEDYYWIDFYAASATSNWYWPYRQHSDPWVLPVAVTNWNEDEPMIPHESENARPRCAYIRTDWDSRWVSDNCDQLHHFICKKVVPSKSPPPTPKPVIIPPGQILACPEKWAAVGDHCLQVVRETNTWGDAATACQKNGGNLFTIRDREDTEFLKRIPFSDHSWIGLNSIQDDNDPREFVWMDGSPVLYTPWMVESSHSNNTGDAARNDVNCGVFTHQGMIMHHCAAKKTAICGSSRILVDGSNRPTSPPIPHDPNCLAFGWHFQGKCYYFGQDPTLVTRPLVSFDQARTFCQTNFKGDLAVITTPFEQQFISSYSSYAQADFWIGMRASTSDVITAFSKWIDGSSVSMTMPWAAGQPVLTSGQPAESNCLALHGTHSDTILPGAWFVDKCAGTKFALCEANRLNAPTNAPVPGRSTTRKPFSQLPKGCPKSWLTDDSEKYYLPFCYKYYEGQAVGQIRRVTWQQAENFCKRFPGGHLATIVDTNQQSFITYDVINSKDRTLQAWIGLRQNPDKGDAWEWADGRPLTGTNFKPALGENHESDLPDCAAIETFNGKWVKQNCQQAWGWVCEIPKGTYSDGEMVEVFPPPVPTSDTCGKSTVQGQWFHSSTTDECLYFSKTIESWKNAQASCRALGSNLVTVSSKTHMFVVTQANQVTTQPSNFWIGLHKTDSQTKEHSWVDGQVSLFRAWEKNEPNPNGLESCVTHNSKSGLWKDINCGRELPFICHKSDRAPTPPPTYDPTAGACPLEWVEYRGACYYFSGPENNTFSESLTACTKELTADKGIIGGNLVSIHSSLENDFIITHARRAHHRHSQDPSPRPEIDEATTESPTDKPRERPYNFWIGLHDNSDKILVWTDNTPFNFNNWHAKEPVTFRPNSCIDFGTDFARVGRWSNPGCKEKRAFICKAPKQPNLTPIEPLPSKCPAGFVEYGNNCFTIEKLEAGQATWTKGQDKCHHLADGHGDIATIVDIYENAEFRVLLNQRMVTDGVKSASAWIGMQEHDGDFGWHNSCPQVFSNFQNLYAKPGERLSCVRMTDSGKWEIAACDTEAAYVVCERRLEPCPPVYHNPDQFLYCKPDFPVECTRTCYRIVAETNHHVGATHRNSIHEARSNCTKLGGRLAAIRNADDQKCILGHSKYVTQNMWIGLGGVENMASDMFEVDWHWETNATHVTAPTTFVNWEEGFPVAIQQYSPKICVQMLPNGKWVNTFCTSSEDVGGYICENIKERREIPRRTTRRPDHYHHGMSGGAIAGLVIGLLLVVGIIAAIAFIRVTGRTDAVLMHVQSMTSTVRSAGSRLPKMSLPSLPRRNKSTADDKERVIPEEETDVESGGQFEKPFGYPGTTDSYT